MERAGNCQKRLDVAGNGWIWLEIAECGRECLEMYKKNFWKWLERAGNGQKCLGMSGYGWNWLEWLEMTGNGWMFLNMARHEMAKKGQKWLQIS